MSALRERLRAQGGLVAEAVGSPAPDEDTPGPGRLAAAGPRASAAPERYELLVDLIHEGYLLHYEGRGRVVAPADPDLALLAGDQLYALGLADLAEIGDLEAVRELADVISLCAQARAAGRRDLADAVWEAGASAVGWGASDAHEAAEGLAREGHDGAAAALLSAARDARADGAQGR